MDIKVDDVENLLWENGIEYEIVTHGTELTLQVLGLPTLVELKPIWTDEEGESILDSDDLYVYAGEQFFGQINAVTAVAVVEELEKILEDYR